MRFLILALAALAAAGSTGEPNPTPTPTPTPSSVCTKFPYDALLSLSSNTAAMSWCSKNFPVACTGQEKRKKIEARTADPEPVPTTLVKRGPKPNPAALLSTLEALGKGFASTACACIETPTPC